MSYFKQPKKPKPQRNTLDGFVPRTIEDVDRASVQSKFRSAYRPSSDVGNRQTRADGFISHKPYESRPSMGFQRIDRSMQENLESHRQNKQNNESLFEKQTQPESTRRFFKKHSHLKKRAKRSKFKKTARAFSALLIATVIGITSLFAYGYIKTRNIFKGNGEGAAALQRDVDPARLNGEGDGRVNILMIGKGGEGHTAPDLTDSLLLASIDPVANEAALVSVPRDMYVKNNDGYSMKINAIYSTAKQLRLANGNDSDGDIQAAEDAGLDAVQDAVSEVLGIPVHYYIMVDFTAFKDAINTVGGITVDVKEPLYDRSIAWLLGGNPLVADSGLQTFDGDRALLYARSRMGSARGDFDRTERQREIIVALQKKVMSLGTFSNPFKVAELLTTFGDRVRTDLNGLDEIKRLYEIGQQISSDKITSVGLADPPNILVRTDNISGQSVVVPSAGLYQYGDIQSYIRNTIRDPFLKRENARVVILNGTSTPGLATATSEELKSYGYNVVSVDNAPTDNYVHNQLIDLTDGAMRYTKSYLEKRVGLSSTTSAPAGIPTIDQADFVIILGTDEVIKTSN